MSQCAIAKVVGCCRKILQSDKALPISWCSITSIRGVTKAKAAQKRCDGMTFFGRSCVREVHRRRQQQCRVMMSVGIAPLLHARDEGQFLMPPCDGLALNTATDSMFQAARCVGATQHRRWLRRRAQIRNSLGDLPNLDDANRLNTLAWGTVLRFGQVQATGVQQSAAYCLWDWSPGPASIPLAYLNVCRGLPSSSVWGTQRRGAGGDLPGSDRYWLEEA